MIYLIYVVLLLILIILLIFLFFKFCSIGKKLVKGIFNCFKKLYRKVFKKKNNEQDK